MRRPRFFGIGRCLVAGLLGWVAWGCKDAPNPTGPTPVGPDTVPPLLLFSPSQDTVVDSIGVLAIAVSAHDQSPIDSIVLVAQGVPNSFQSVYPQDTTALVFWTVALGTLHHRPFTFQVVAGDVLGHRTTTKTIKVTPR